MGWHLQPLAPLGQGVQLLPLFSLAFLCHKLGQGRCCHLRIAFWGVKEKNNRGWRGKRRRGGSTGEAGSSRRCLTCGKRENNCKGDRPWAGLEQGRGLVAPLCHGAEPLGQGARAGGCSLLERSILVLLLRREAGELQVPPAAWGSLEAMRFLSSLCVASNKIKQTIPPWYLLPECAALLRRPVPKTLPHFPRVFFSPPALGEGGRGGAWQRLRVPEPPCSLLQPPWLGS